MAVFDLAIAYTWEYDEEFVDLIEKSAQAAGLTTFVISEHNVDEVFDLVQSKKLHFNFLLDRAWDVDDRFGEIGKILNRRKCYIFNAYKKVTHAIDKASMHLEFITGGIHVPYSIIIPPLSEKKEIYISLEELSHLGRPFIIKPCQTTGGGIGVVTGAETLLDVLKERPVNKDDKYLLQEKIVPQYINGKRAWYRCFWAFGQPIITWWDDTTHIYTEMGSEDERMFNYKKLLTTVRKTAKICELDFFSTEIVLTHENKFVSVDYVNDMCDMRMRSRHIDGVPDSIAKTIVNNLIKSIFRIKRYQNKN